MPRKSWPAWSRKSGSLRWQSLRDGPGVLLVAVGLAWVELTRDKLGLVVAFAGVALLAYGVLRPRSQQETKDPPIF
jgi:hypothetical protein